MCLFCVISNLTYQIHHGEIAKKVVFLQLT